MRGEAHEQRDVQWIVPDRFSGLEDSIALVAGPRTFDVSIVERQACHGQSDFIASVVHKQ